MGTKEFKTYVAADKINCGVDKETSITITKGTFVKYNGTKAIIEGEEYNFPRLSSAIKARWLVDVAELGVGETAQSSQPQSANISMRGATPQQEDVIAASTTLAEEDREVSSVQAFRDGDHRQAAVDAARRQLAAAEQALAADQAPQTVGRNNMVIEDQGGREVQGISFKTKAGTDSMEESVRMDRLSHNAISKMEEGTERRDKGAHFAALARQKMEREIAILKQELQQAKASDQPQVREGIQFRTEGISDRAAGTTRQQPSNEPEGIWDGHGAETVATVTPQVQVSVGGTYEATPELSVEDKDSRLAFARQMMPNFDWDFSQHWKTKLKELETNSNPLFVCTVYAVESPAMKKHIASQFPDLNLGN